MDFVVLMVVEDAMVFAEVTIVLRGEVYVTVVSTGLRTGTIVLFKARDVTDVERDKLSAIVTRVVNTNTD